MEAEIPHHDDALDLDADALELAQHQWLQFTPGTATAVRCRCILHMSVVTPRCIDWGGLADAGQANRAFAILGEDTPAHQAAVPEQEDEELSPDIEFSLCGQHHQMTIERFAMVLGLYY
ncbi:hypothetical protein R6Q59_032912 [Mikania micrantha]